MPIIKGDDLASYNSLKAQGYKTLWSGEGKIHMQAPDGSTSMSKTLAVLDIPMTAWAASLEAMDPPTRNGMSVDLSAIMERAARLKGYIEGRYMYEKRDHSFAVVASNKLAARIRKVLGFAYPQNDISF